MVIKIGALIFKRFYLFITRIGRSPGFNFEAKSIFMNALRNQAQLIGYVGNDPEITELQGGKKLAKFSLATNEIYNNAAGERTVSTEWHTIIAWDRQAEIAEKYVQKGKEIAVSGRITHRSYDDNEGQKKRITEIRCSDLLLLGKPEAAIETEVF